MEHINESQQRALLIIAFTSGLACGVAITLLPAMERSKWSLAVGSVAIH